MIVSSSPPLQRVHEILQRMQTDTDNVECLKTCCGALAILAKDEANKLLIARDGTRLILTVMEGHATRPDLQEAVCDLLWSLAFNNGLVKEVVGRQGGIALILKGMSSHLSSPELVKSACGALSNMCQNTYNQNLIAAHGGVRTILSALHSHRMNAPLLPFVFDALASLIVGNQRNGLLVTDGGGIRGVLSTMSLHSGKREVVKSGCHALAILSDIQGQGARIAGADGVKVLLPALRAHVRFLHLHRIAAIVLLRMLQEAAVARDIAAHGGVVIMLGMLREHAREEETVAATVHILYLITHADVMSGAVEVEVSRHFNGIPPPIPVPIGGGIRGVGATRGGSSLLSGSGSGGNALLHGALGDGGGGSASGVECSSMNDRDIFSSGSVRALVLVLQAHMERKDIVRAAMRSAANLIRIRAVVGALIMEETALPTVLQCLALHTTSRGITDSTVAVAGALLAAAHESGWASTSTEHLSRQKHQGCIGRPSIDGFSANAGGGGGIVGGGGHFQLSLRGAAPGGLNGNGRGQQLRSTPRHQQQKPQLPKQQQPTLLQAAAGMAGIPPTSKGGFALRFAYTPLQDARSTSTLETGLRGQGPSAAAATVSAAVVAKSEHRGSASITTAAATTAAAMAVGKRVAGDAGGWSSSMQALCAILRARRRDPTLAGLVFLALEACIEEWANACNPVGLPSAPLGGAGGARGGWGNDPGAPVGKAALVEVTAAASTLSLVAERDSVLPASTLSAPLRRDIVGTSEGAKKLSATAVASKVKMHLGVRESLKAGLVWAEAVPLGRNRAAIGAGGVSGDRRPSSLVDVGNNGASVGVGVGVGCGAGELSTVTPADDGVATAAETSFSVPMAEAVERLCRWLRRGFTEMGFGRVGTAVPLGEAVSLLAFDANVPEVLERLRAARQPNETRECVEYLMRMFLPDALPEPPPVGSVDDTVISPTDKYASDLADLSRSARGEAGNHERGGASSDCDASNEDTISGQLNAGNPGVGTVEGYGTGRGGVGVESGNGGLSSHDSDDHFWDEGDGDGSGLVMSSPLVLEPILLPSSAEWSASATSCSSNLAGLTTGSIMSPSVSAGSGAPTFSNCGSTGPPQSFAYARGQGTLSTRYPLGTSGASGAGGGGGSGAPGAAGDDRLWLVYEGLSAAGRGIVSRINAPDPYWLGRASPGAVCPYAHSMKFNSCFESANLLRAVQRGPAEYDLFLRPDLHTHGHTQWFYFALRETHPPGVEGESVVKFNVVNLTKPDSLFAMGMRPVLYSHQDAAREGFGWRRCGQKINYFSNGHSWYKPDGSNANFYTLTLSVTFPNAGDTYRLAHAHPYSYSDHKRHLAKLLANERTARFLTHKVLCTTLGGHDCDMLTVTDDEEVSITTSGVGTGRDIDCPQTLSQSPGQGDQNSVAIDDICGSNQTPEGTVGSASGGGSGPASGVGNENTCGIESGRGSIGGGRGRCSKRCVVISARVHPGETPASWMMRGILDFLTGESAEARVLRSLFVFKIVPMLNPDGVAFGNNRCSLAGVDLNRQWKRPSRSLHPTVFWLKQHIRQEQGRRGVATYIDLHGHSRKMNVFMYGADEKRRGVSCPSARVLPKLLSWNRLGSKYVSFKDCSFAVKKGREATARVVVARDLAIGNSYTVESTFCGVDFGPLKDHHLNTDHLQEAGLAICDTLLDYYLPSQAQRKRAHRDLVVRDRVEGNEALGMPLPGMIPTLAIAGVGVNDGVKRRGADDWSGDRGGGFDEAGDNDSSTEAGCLGVGGGNGGKAGPEHDERDDDDDVVDNNDDIESEDDNDSVPLDSPPEDTDLDAEMEQSITPSLEQGVNSSRPSAAKERTADMAAGLEAGSGEGDRARVESEYANNEGGRISSRSDGERTSMGSMIRDERAHDDSITGSNGSRPLGQPVETIRIHADGARTGEGEHVAWAGMDWVKRETGTGNVEMVRRWGRVVDEANDEVALGEDSGTPARLPLDDRPSPTTEEMRAKHSENPGKDNDGKGVAAGEGAKPRRGAGKRLSARGKNTHRLSSKERGGGGHHTESEAPTAFTAEAAMAAAATALERGNSSGRANLACGDTPPSGGKKERRGTLGSRGPKALALTNGNRSKGSDRVSAARQQRIRRQGVGGDGAARRASDAALQAASNVLAACNGSTQMSKSRRRVRSLSGAGSGVDRNVGLSRDNGSGSSGSSGASRGVNGSSRGNANSVVIRGPAGAGGGRGWAREGDGIERSGTHGPAYFSNGAGDAESAPRSGSSLDGTTDVITSRGVVKRGGNPRWLSPTGPTSNCVGHVEGNWSRLGTLPPNIAQHLGATQRSFMERVNSDARFRHMEIPGAPEARSSVGRSGSVKTSSGADPGLHGTKDGRVDGDNVAQSSSGEHGGVCNSRGKDSDGSTSVRGRIIKGRSVFVASGGGERCQSPAGSAGLVELPALEEGGSSGGNVNGGGGIGAGVNGSEDFRRGNWTEGEASSPARLFMASRVAARGQDCGARP